MGMFCCSDAEEDLLWAPGCGWGRSPEMASGKVFELKDTSLSGCLSPDVVLDLLWELREDSK